LPVGRITPKREVEPPIFVAAQPKFLFVANPDHCRSGSLESPDQSVEPGCKFVEASEHVDLAVLADTRATSSPITPSTISIGPAA